MKNKTIRGIVVWSIVSILTVLAVYKGANPTKYKNPMAPKRTYTSEIPK